MNITEREKTIFREILQKGIIKDEDLENAGYMPSEIEEIKDNKDWKNLYRTRDVEEVIKIQKLLIQVVGDDWKKKYDYNESKKSGVYSLIIKIEKENYDKLCHIWEYGGV